jgi:Xaa-Pro aminopeptidase
MLDDRRRLAATAWNLSDELVLIGAGKPIGIPGGMDQCFPYKPHPEYRWLAERRREGGVLAYDPKEGWTLFEPPVTELELVWGGGPPATGKPIEELAGWIEARPGRKIAVLGCAIDGAAADPDFSSELRLALTHARRPKDASEIELMRRAARATAAGHAAAQRFIRPGVTEREIQVEFESAICRAGADGPGYESIVGTGSSSAIFHYAPSHTKKVEPGDFVLIDAGAEVDAYVIDVTRTYPAEGRFAPDQQAIYDAVLKSLIAGNAACVVGAEWLDVHALAARSLASSLVDMGFLKCSAEEAMESEAIAMFLPHGIGHMVGLGVRDASGAFPGRTREAKAGGVRIRMDIPLDEGYTVTVEPGLYFSPAILGNEERRSKYASHVDWGLAESWIGRGGVRIEDNVLVTASGPVVLTDEIPK